MDILAISGCNIASLAQPFDIDLETGPLAGCGLFAITGKTGAGKSSLLDAMCLALYDDCPRLGASGVDDRIPDSSGEFLNSRNPQTLLRRGAAEGFAAVRFRARDGQPYEARWSVRRARSKPTGRLQAVDRALVRLSDGTVLETQKTRVNDQVIALTGLTYPEFRRSVLLAQGDFDSFLSADAKNRAAILEKVTDTGLYRDISKRVFKSADAADRDVQDLTIKLGEHTVLSEDEKEDLTRQAEQVRTQRDLVGRALQEVQADLDYYNALREAKTRLTAAQTARDTAQERWEEAVEDRNTLAQITQANAVRAEYQELKQAQAALEDAQRNAAHVMAELAQAKGTEEKAREAAELARTELDEVEAQFKSFGPIWTKAEQLDARIDTAQSEVNAAQIALDRQTAEAQTHQSAVLQSQQALAQLSQTVLNAQTAVQTDPDSAVINAHWDILFDSLTRRVAAAKAEHEAQAQIDQVDTEIGTAQQHQSQLAQQIETQSNSLSGHVRALETATKTRNTLADTDPNGRLARVVTAMATVDVLSETARRYADVDAQMQNTAQALSDLDAAEARSTGDQKDAARAQDAARARMEALQAPTDLAEASISPQAAHLRHHLIPGDPCPVCHATEHPVHDDPALARIATDLRARLDAARHDLETVTDTINRCAVTLAQAKQDRLRHLKDNEQAKTLQNTLRAQYHDHAATLAQGPIADHVPFDINGASSKLLELIQTMKGWQEDLQQGAHDLEKAEQVAEARKRSVADAEMHLRRLQTDLEQSQASTQNARETRGTAQHQVSDARKHMREIDHVLTRRFPDLELIWRNYDAEGDAALQALASRHAASVEARAKLETALKAQAEQNALLDSQTQDAGAAQTGLSNAQAYHKTRQIALDALVAERAPLLNGQDTGTHRTALNAQRTQTAQRHQAAFDAQAKALSETAALRAKDHSSADVKHRATKRRARADAALLTQCTAAGIAPEALDALLERAKSDVDRLKSHLDTLEQARLAATETVKTRSADLTALITGRTDAREDGQLPMPLAEVGTRRAALRAEDDGLQSTAQDIRARLHADADARARQSTILKQIDAAQATRDTWAAVNDCVGSAQGDKFSQIAQEVTLALLVEQANHHLADIKPRYRLAIGAERQLSLHVVDEDMAGEVRSTRSLSGGERFLVSLSLALALSSVGGRGRLAGTLFIDEGFGTLDSESLDLAIDALEALRAQGRMVGVISHVQAMKDRIPMQIRVETLGDGSSRVEIAV